MKKIGVLTSGGDASGMNAAIRAVVRTALYHGLAVVGIERGYSGLINNELKEMKQSSVADIIQRGGTVLRTARSKGFLTATGRAEAANNLRATGIDAIVVIGGNGSFAGASLLNKEHGVTYIGVPATIDNDIPCTDYCIGFDTAVNNVTDAINKIRDTATSHERTFVIEVMGRNSGFIALEAGLASGAESILVPEVEVNLDAIIQKILRGHDRGKLHSIIIVAEGAASGLEIGKEIQTRTGFETKVTILGHIQRGGTPTAFDRIIASRMGASAVELLIAGKTNRMVGYSGESVIDVDMVSALSQKRCLDLAVYNLADILSK